MTGPSQPNEFRYHDVSPLQAALPLVAVASVLLLASVITGLWGISALLHANWLEENDLPVAGTDAWGIAMLLLATAQGTTALLIMFSRRLGAFLGIALAVCSILVNLAVFSAFPVGSLISIGVDVLIITVLIVYRPQR